MLFLSGQDKREILEAIAKNNAIRSNINATLSNMHRTLLDIKWVLRASPASKQPDGATAGWRSLRMTNPGDGSVSGKLCGPPTDLLS